MPNQPVLFNVVAEVLTPCVDDSFRKLNHVLMFQDQIEDLRVGLGRRSTLRIACAERVRLDTASIRSSDTGGIRRDMASVSCSRSYMIRNAARKSSTR